MQSMTVTWTLPTKWTDGTTLPVSQIASSEVSISADNGATWSLLGNVAPNTTQTLQKDLADGAYKIRVLEISTAGVRGLPAIGDCLIKTPLVPSARL
jgi:hypothetical protein